MQILNSDTELSSGRREAARGGEGGISLADVAILGTLEEQTVNTSSHHRLATLLSALLLMAGCKQPADVELTSEVSDENLEVYSVTVSEPDVATSSVDSIAVLPEDQTKHDGLCVINSVTWDDGTTVRHLAYARVFIGDTVARVLGRKVGVRGMDLGRLTLNGTPMLKVPHRIPVNRIFGRDTTIVFGWEYVLDITQSHRANFAYTWTMTPVVGSPRSVGIATPESLVVLAPRSGAVFSRGRNAQLRWTGGTGKMTIIISSYDAVLNQVTPVLEIKAKADNGRVTLPSKLLAMLPAHRYFILTFALANRSVIDVTQPVGGRVLVQAACVHNCYVEVQ